ncbi:hypothetical protein OsJ_05490 [Oryza sativa Japonica Group]|uniref:Uncharacterized protein n=1 Tax=Oryza sativa subsp. japonica TaxID=39947 RepID=B9F363_ORYSJ|nr:hypothetical protein OsJ_05490 [Oryza sativa Japonica Group]
MWCLFKLGDEILAARAATLSTYLDALLPLETASPTEKVVARETEPAKLLLDVGGGAERVGWEVAASPVWGSGSGTAPTGSPLLGSVARPNTLRIWAGSQPAWAATTCGAARASGRSGATRREASAVTAWRPGNGGVVEQATVHGRHRRQWKGGAGGWQ